MRSLLGGQIDKVFFADRQHRLNGNHQHIFAGGFHDDLQTGRQTGLEHADLLFVAGDTNFRLVFLQVRVRPVSGKRNGRNRIDLALKQDVWKRIHLDPDFLSDADLTDLGLVNPGVDFHLGQIRQFDHGLPLADNDSLFNHHGFTAATLLVGVHNLAGLRGDQPATVDLPSEPFQVAVFDRVGQFTGFDIGEELLQCGFSCQPHPFQFTHGL